MAGHIPEHILDDILSRTDIAQLIGSYIPLKRAGRSFKANCPFHHEKTPSFIVSPDKQIYHCFGCQAGGNAFSFLMQYERVEFPEAVEILAKKAGVTLPQSRQDAHGASGLSDQLYKLNELAASFYEQTLDSPQGLEAQNYLVKRGITRETAKLLKLGLAPKKWDGLIKHARAEGVSLTVLEKAGLILAREGGGFYDRFRDRIIFPIFDIKARVIAFGARQICDPSGKTPGDKGSPKYINSPETLLYVKGRHLYGLHLSKDAIRERDSVAVVEGYLDFIAPYQAGVSNIVASLGTALTYEQIRLIKRFTQNVTMVYDADNAGQMATLRSLDMFVEEGMSVRVVSLPAGFDPDSFIRAHGAAEFRGRIAEAENLFDYKIRILKSRHNVKDIEHKAAVSLEMLSTIHKCKNAILRSEYIRKLAQELDVAEDALLAELRKIKEPGVFSHAGPDVKKKLLNVTPTEKLLIQLMLEESSLISRVKDVLEPADFQDERVSQAVSLMFELFEQGKRVEPSCLVNKLRDDSILRLVCESSVSEEVSEQHKEKIIDDCIQRLKGRRLNLRKQCLHREIKTAQASGDEERLHKLMSEFQHLTKAR